MGLVASYDDRERLLFDTGAAIHVCPENYATEFPLRPPTYDTPHLTTVTGAAMKVYGERTVYYELVPGGFGHVNYIVTDVTMPILSVTTMLSNGWSAELSAHDQHPRGGPHQVPTTTCEATPVCVPSTTDATTTTEEF